MIHIQVQATLANGATELFGTKADSDEDALDVAHERLAETGQLVTEVDVEPLAPAAGRQ
jgi:hypothetical protein